MSVKTQSVIGMEIEALLDEVGAGTPYNAGLKMAVNPSYFNQVVKYGKKLSPHVARRLQEVFNIDGYALLELQMAQEYAVTANGKEEVDRSALLQPVAVREKKVLSTGYVEPSAFKEEIDKILEIIRNFICEHPGYAKQALLNFFINWQVIAEGKFTAFFVGEMWVDRLLHLVFALPSANTDGKKFKFFSFTVEHPRKFVSQILKMKPDKPAGPAIHEDNAQIRIHPHAQERLKNIYNKEEKEKFLSGLYEHLQSYTPIPWKHVHRKSA